MWDLIKLLFYFFVAPYLVFAMIKVVAEDAPYLLIFFWYSVGCLVVIETY
ncbi:hypothetical protein [Capnocytophaga canimorsus]|uniref:Uncharacterized protein n=1 Tax=Capnocytophaga canimorsus TaxID=28188 RepID=A0A0B7IDM5_9FLAO|nr:hypothetical protein [Capnocytophaga canimorsus]CEN48078.1 exported hypothetical protein [Capnocytophaga canimorsus]